jgi:antitoxin component of MazEF toxin-antitoxin module
MEKKFVKTGNSYAIVIPSSVLSMLGINPKSDKVNLALEDKKIIIQKAY